MRRSLFLHVPKTGGTSLDSLLAEHVPAERSLRNLQVTSPMADWDRLDEPDLLYLSGHLPAGGVDLSRFNHRVTILREPRAMVASLVSYTDMLMPSIEGLRGLLDGGSRYSPYSAYFGPDFDRTRLLTDMRYGITSDLSAYASPCSLEQALQVLSGFHRVLNFEHLDGEIMRLIMEEGLFPPSSIPKARRYAYQPDLALADALLSPFDLEFYAAARAQFRPLAASLPADYSAYRSAYAITHGLNVGRRDSTELPIRGPLGTGWLTPNRSEDGLWFRWCDVPDPVIDIPISQPGHYEVRVYVHPHNVSTLDATLAAADTWAGTMEAQVHGHVSVFHGEARLDRPGWLAVRCRGALVDQPKGDSGTVESLHFVLGRVLLRRVS